MDMKSIFFFLMLVLLGCNNRSVSESASPDEYVENQESYFNKVGDLPIQTTIPNLFLLAGDDSVKTLKEWQEHRLRIKNMLSFYQYGEMPPKPSDVKVTETGMEIKNGSIHSDYDFTITKNEKSLTFRVGLIRPEKPGTFPVIIKNDRYRFDVAEVENERVRQKYFKQKRDVIDGFVAGESLQRGYVYCKFIREDVASDVNGPREGRIFDLYPEYEWGAITAWAWTYQIIIDWLEQQNFADVAKIIATGHSRGGKTALCAGIFDERIAVTAPNSSGIGGTASFRFYDLSQRIQTIDHHKKRFFHWWPERWYSLAENLEKVPFDAHFAKALIAPRALLNTHARHDYWANPYGTYLTYLLAQPVFDLYKVGEHNAIHWRDGGHAQNEEDWLALFDYCDQVFYKKPTSRLFTLNPDSSLYQFDSLAGHDLTKIEPPDNR